MSSCASVTRGHPTAVFAGGSVTWDEFTAFWKNVVGSGYSQEDLIEEVEMMLEGGSWVDFNDGRTT